MLTKIMKWFSITGLLTAMFWQPSEGLGVLLQMVVSVSAVLVVVQAVQARKYLWGIGFLSIAVLFNPVAPIAFSRGGYLWLNFVCLAMFAISLAALKTRPLISVTGIINPGRRSQSL
jgi:hypothetical protein